MKAAITKNHLRAAERIFAVSNTPSFLIRKFRDDQAIRRLAEMLTPDQVISEIKRAIKKQPKTLRDIVLPYALGVALSWYSDATPLRVAAKLKAPHHPWFTVIVDDLLRRHSAVQYLDFKIAARQPAVQSWTAG